MRLLVAIPVVAAIALSGPAFAQQKASDADAMAKVQKIVAQFDNGFKKQDATALSELFTKDGVYVPATGKKFTGQQQIAEGYSNVFKAMGGIKAFDAKADEVHALSDGGTWAIGRATIEGGASTTKSHWAAVYVPEGNEFKVRMLSVGADVSPQPQTAQKPSAPATSGSTTK